MSTNDKPAVYTIDEIAALFRIGRNSAYEAVERGDIPAIRIGRRKFVPRAVVERLLASQ